VPPCAPIIIIATRGAAGERFGASVPIQKALADEGDVVLAYEMNGELIPRDHGYPLRAVIPGHVAARSVKWLEKVIVSDEESESHWQQRDYKGFCPGARVLSGALACCSSGRMASTCSGRSVKLCTGVRKQWQRHASATLAHVPAGAHGLQIMMPLWCADEDWEHLDWSKAPAIQEVPITSSVIRPSADKPLDTAAKTVKVEGYAVAGGGRAVVRVDVSADGGETWQPAELGKEGADQGYRRHWAWRHWQVWPALAPF
jgi:sulfite oxidase